MLKTTILDVLKVCDRAGRTLPKDLLKKQCELTLDKRIGDREFDEAFNALLDKQLIDFDTDPITDDRKYRLSEQGRAVS